MVDYKKVPIEDIFPGEIRILNVLRGRSNPACDWDKAPIKTLGDLIKLKQEDFLKAPNLGWKSFKKIKEAVAKYGFTIESVYPKRNVKFKFNTEQSHIDPKKMKKIYVTYGEGAKMKSGMQIQASFNTLEECKAYQQGRRDGWEAAEKEFVKSKEYRRDLRR
jgi:hypothetical protein